MPSGGRFLFLSGISLLLRQSRLSGQLIALNEAFLVPALENHFSCVSVFTVGPMAAASRLPRHCHHLTDDQGYADVGVFGARGFQNAESGSARSAGSNLPKFSRGFQPVCSASRAALLTGCYPNRLGIHGALGPKSKSRYQRPGNDAGRIGEAKGYATAIFGKWHLEMRRSSCRLRHGFDEYFGLPYFQ